MKFEVVVSQGRVADKTARTIPGAASTADALRQRYGVSPIAVGTASPAADDDWAVSLPQAHDTLTALSAVLSGSMARGAMTVLASNTCSASLVSLPTVARHYPDALVLWFDAHGDFNTLDTTESGYLGGMVVAAACGLWDSGHGAGLNSEQVMVIGGRDIDPAEATLMKDAGIRIIPPVEATPGAVHAAVGDAKVWIHIDWDVLEPGYVPADYKVGGGLLPLQLRSILAALPREQVLGLELAEYQVPDDPVKADRAVAHILEIVKPILG
jgi:arginase